MQPDPSPSSETSPFVYADTGPERAGIAAISARLAGGVIGIIGAGGTGSVVLDLIAKTPVDRIVLIDGDVMEAHNAFRAPGAARAEVIAERPFKVEYLRGVYSAMHRCIDAHATHLTAQNFHLLDDLDFAFLCLDSARARGAIVPEFDLRDLPFIDCGVGLEVANDSLTGMIRVTSSVPSNRSYDARIPQIGADEVELYRSNIQVADLNTLAATLAVIQYKQMRQFYADSGGEGHMIYRLEDNAMLNAAS
jgi:hypothetical protein